MAALPFVPLLADIGDVLAAGAAILIPLVYVVRAILASRGAGKQQPQRAAPRRVPPPQQGPAASEQKQLTDEVEEFLRRAAERRRGGQPRDVEIVRVEPMSPRRPDARPQQGDRPKIFRIESDEERIGSESVSRHVAQHLDTADYAERASHMVTVDNADEQMEAHLSAVFDHQVGHLGQPSVIPSTGDPSGQPNRAASDAPLPPAAASIADLLVSPTSIRNAFVLQEILRRPEENW